MSASDAILVGEGWISEHYFTTDAGSQSFRARVIERRKAWDAGANEQRRTPRSRFIESRQSLESEFARLAELTGLKATPDALDRQTVAEAVDPIYNRLLDILEVDGHGLLLDSKGPLSRVSSIGMTERAPLVVVLAQPVDAIEDVLAKDGDTLLEPVALTEDGPEITSAARLVGKLFVEDDAAPEVALVLAGRWAVLAERERWAEGRYLAIDLQLVCERNDTRRGGEIDRALTCLCAESIAPDADGSLWWHGVLEESVKHTVGVSEDLRDGVRTSIEIIANEVVGRRTAAGLESLPAAAANELAKQSLRFLYRILFLLYAEASPELGVLPVGAQEYDAGYSLDRLRELVQVELATPQARAGKHLYESLGVLFRLVDSGHTPVSPLSREKKSAFGEGLTFNALRADLFRPEATGFIDEVGLGNVAVQEVLVRLLLSKERRGRDRGFISYAELGINQLGRVYEGLMSYTGFFAETDLYEVAKGGDSSKGSWVVPVDRAEDVAPADFVKYPDKGTGELKPVLHVKGSFVFRLAGRERQQSASYYTPEVLTKFTVGQALEELLDQDGRTTTAEEVLRLTVCEPALGSGAFAIEAVRQLAEQYLKRRQDELGERIDPDDYPRRLQEVKAYLALHNVYGVDRNATAVELAEISLWLDTMVSGLSAPWFGLHLRRGNSLIGTRRAVYRRGAVNSKAWLTAVPQDVPLSSLVADIEAERIGGDIGAGIHHFLLPADGWGATADAKEAATLVPDAVERLKQWRTSVKSKPSRQQVDALTELSHRVEKLWQIALRRLSIAEQEVRRAIPIWGAAERSSCGTVQREEIEAALANEEGAYRRLRRVMDAWTALWFWPLTETLTMVETPEGARRIEPPTLDQWIAGLRALLGRSPELGKRGKAGQRTLGSATSWDELEKAEDLELSFAGARPIETVLDEHPWLTVCERVAERQGFFHWHLDFATVFSRGGFDLQVGNPPWVRPDTDFNALLAEGDPWWQLVVKPTEQQKSTRRSITLELPGITDLVVDGTTDTAAIATFVGSMSQYPKLAGLRPDLYRCFMEQTWRHEGTRGVVGLIHLDTHFTDDKAGPLRKDTYVRLRRHWEFVNERKLFEIQHQKHFSINVYGAARDEPSFMHAVALYHPDTVLRSFAHDGSGDEPGLKDLDGNWDLRPHRNRITRVERETLKTWHVIAEAPDIPVLHTRMAYAVNHAAASMLETLARAQRIGDLGMHSSDGWNETTDRKKGLFEKAWGEPDSWNDVILQGSHLFVATPMYKAPNVTMKNKDDWSVVDLETVAADAVPITIYKPAGSRDEYNRDYSHWIESGSRNPARTFYRVAWRTMAANTGERTLTPAVIPPGVAHVHAVQALGTPHGDNRLLLLLQAILCSVVADFVIRCVPKSAVSARSISRLPWNDPLPCIREAMLLRALRLNCLTDVYAALWRDCYSPEYQLDSWTGGLEHALRRPVGAVGAEWSAATPLRVAADRRQALVELDALVALMLGLTADELCSIYRTQFPVLHSYDRNLYVYDANGRLVPNSVLAVWRKKGDRVSVDERTATNKAGNTYTYEPPFVTLDREADMRQAYAHFERRAGETS